MTDIHVDITEDRLDLEKLTNFVTSPSCGAVSVFIGTTRNNFDGKKVLQLEYEAYIPMAKKKMLEICQQIGNSWSIEKIAMEHRLGVVPVAEASIIIAISSPHRKESLEAVQYAIDMVKAVVPVWKKEIYEDDTSEWKENKECYWKST